MNKLCENIDTLSMAYLDDELAEEELVIFELHLHDCASCRAQVDAERDAIAELRRRLAPPPTPDLVRARLIATLDTEDALVAREERGQRFASWMLPGAASLVAVAALALFAFGRGGPRTETRAPSIAEQVVQQQVHSPRIAPSMGRQVDVGIGATAPNTVITVNKVATWESRIRDRDVVTQLFQVEYASGGESAIQASVFDARGWDLTDSKGQHVRTSGLDLLVGYANGVSIVVYQAANGLGYVFSANAGDIDTSALVDLVAERDLVTRMAPPR